MSRLGITTLPRLEDHRDAITRLVEKVFLYRENISDQLVDFHNFYTAYNLLLQMCGSSARLVDDPLCNSKDYVPEIGLQLITDKEMSPAHRNRASWMCEIQLAQGEFYGDYLIWLMDTLRERGYVSLARGVASIISEGVLPRQQLLPRYFFVDEHFEPYQVTETALSSMVRGVWDFRTNSSRKILETTLRSLDVPQWIVDGHLGHIVDGVPPFTDSSSLAYADLRDFLTEKLQIVLELWGFSAIEGPNVADREVRVLEWKSLERFWTPGPESRVIAASKRREAVLAELGMKLDSLLAITDSGNDVEEELEHTRASLLETFGDEQDSVDFVFHELDRYIEEARSVNPALEKIKRVMVLPQKRPLLGDSWSIDYRYSSAVINRFQGYLESIVPTSVSQSWAMIVVAAGLGGLYNSSWLNSMAMSGPSGVRREKDLMYQDIYVNDAISKKGKRSKRRHKASHDRRTRPNWRWIPDPLSRGLLLGTENRFGASAFTEKVNEKDLLREITKIFTAIELEAHSDLEASCRAICNASKPYWLIHHPGWLVTVLEGRQSCTPLSETAFIRLYSGEYLREKRQEDSKTVGKREERESAIRGCYMDLLRRYGKAGRKRRKTRKDKKSKALPDELATSNPISTREEYVAWKKRMFRGAKRSKERVQTRLAKQTRKMLLSSPDLPDNCRLVAEWFYVMCLTGTRVRAKDRVRTLRAYLDIVDDVIEYFCDYSILDLDSSELQDLMISALTALDWSDTPRAIGRLLDFHHFLVEFYGADPLDWSVVYGYFGKNFESEADSQYLTGKEFQKALSWAKKLPSGESEFVAGALILGYRFNLRMGEVMRLTVQDMQLQDAGTSVIQVRPSRYGSTKSHAGIRGVPVLRALDHHEYDLLEKLQFRAETWSNDNLDALVFSFNGEAISRSNLNDKITCILRAVTGDQRFRFHHLRHAWVNRHFFDFMSAELESANLMFFRRQLESVRARDSKSLDSIRAEVDKLLFRDGGIDPFSLDELAELTGHNSCSTTITAYFALAEVIAEAYASKFCPFQLEDEGVGNLLGQSPQYVGNRRLRLRIRKESSHRIFETLKFGNQFENTSKRLEPSTVKPDFPLARIDEPEPSLVDIDRVLCAYARRRQQVDNLGFISGVDQWSAERIVDVASDIENRSGYRLYGLEDPGNLVSGRNNPSYRAMYKMSERFHEFLVEIESKLGCDPDAYQKLGELLDCWSSCYLRTGDRDALMSHSYREDELCARLFLFLGVQAEDLRVRVPSGANLSVSERLRYWHQMAEKHNPSAASNIQEENAFVANFGMTNGESRFPIGTHIDRKRGSCRLDISCEIPLPSSESELSGSGIHLSERDSSFGGGSISTRRWYHRAAFILYVYLELKTEVKSSDPNERTRPVAA